MGIEVIYYSDPVDPKFGTTTTVVHPALPMALNPNNPGNPYFGKKIISMGVFIGLAFQVLGTTRFARLTGDPAFKWVQMIINVTASVDTDDAAGQFLKIVTYLTATNAADNQPLLSAADMTAIMAAWPVS